MFSSAGQWYMISTAVVWCEAGEVALLQKNGGSTHKRGVKGVKVEEEMDFLGRFFAVGCEMSICMWW